jgi:exopolysaccharide biosynthesis polyprenyl glycosylphosphotransferase
MPSEGRREVSTPRRLPMRQVPAPDGGDAERTRPQSASDALDFALDDRTLKILEHRRATATVRRRGWLVQRTLAISDMLALVLAFAITGFTADGFAAWSDLGASQIFLVFAALPAWTLAARLLGLYRADRERANHSTADEFVAALQLLTLGCWLYLVAAWLLGHRPSLTALVTFWGVALATIVIGRILTRRLSRRRLSYVQNAVIVGAGNVGQLVARKLLRHPEYGINVVGFVDANPKERRPDLQHLTLLGTPEELPKLARLLDLDRVIVAFSNESHDETVRLLRSLRGSNLQIDIVPRLFEFIGPNAIVHAVEGVPLLGMPPAHLTRAARIAKRGLDILFATTALIVLAPVFAFIALRIKLDSPGPVFFRQLRLGSGMREFTSLKFRTMADGTDDSQHEEYIRSTMTALPTPEANGLFKLTRDGEVTNVGRWLRRTSLDELPQLINILRGDMSLVGPRPCIPYEIDHFAPHHFERFQVPAGLTGLWQVTARAHATFAEALDMDVAYVRSYSFGLDLRLLFRTPAQVLRRDATA